MSNEKVSPLVEEMEKEKSKRLEGNQEVVDYANQLLLENSQGEREALGFLGLDDHIKQAENQTRLSIMDRKYSEEYEGKVFHIDEIEKVAMKYRLFLKMSKFYRGTIPTDLGSIVARMKAKHNLSLNHSEHSDAGRFMILAPPHMFKNYMTMGDKIMEAGTDTAQKMKESFEAAQRAMQPDPCLFYQVDGEHYILLKKWGADFNFERKVRGFFTRSNNWAFVAILFALIMLVQVPFRAWTLVDYAVAPEAKMEWSTVAKKEIASVKEIANPIAYYSSHLGVSIVLGLIVLVIGISAIAVITNTKKTRWALSEFSTRDHFKSRRRGHKD